MLVESLPRSIPIQHYLPKPEPRSGIISRLKDRVRPEHFSPENRYRRQMDSIFYEHLFSTPSSDTNTLVETLKAWIFDKRTLAAIDSDNDEVKDAALKTVITKMNLIGQSDYPDEVKNIAGGILLTEFPIEALDPKNPSLDFYRRTGAVMSPWAFDTTAILPFQRYDFFKEAKLELVSPVANREIWQETEVPLEKLIAYIARGENGNSYFFAEQPDLRTLIDNQIVISNRYLDFDEQIEFFKLDPQRFKRGILSHEYSHRIFAERFGGGEKSLTTTQANELIAFSCQAAEDIDAVMTIGLATKLLPTEEFYYYPHEEYSLFYSSFNQAFEENYQAYDIDSEFEAKRRSGSLRAQEIRDFIDNCSPEFKKKLKESLINAAKATIKNLSAIEVETTLTTKKKQNF